MTSVKIKGLSELVKVLDKAAIKVPDARRQFLAKEAGLVRGRTMKRTPVDTGLLRGSWKQTPANNQSVTIYNNVHYAPYVEFGHRVKVRGKFTGKTVAGRRMLRSAIEESKASFKQDSEAILNSIFAGGSK